MNGSLTSAWRQVPARRLFSVIEERGFLDLPLLSSSSLHGVVPRERLQSRVAMPQGDTALYKRVKPGDFVVSMGSFDTGVEYSPFEGLVSPAYTVLRPHRGLVHGYYRHLLKSGPVIAALSVLARGIRQGKTITWDDFAALRLPLPPEQAQLAIAGHLDIETDRIDALVQTKRRMIELLEERSDRLAEGLVADAEPSSRLPLSSVFRLTKGVDAQRLTAEYCSEHPGPFPVYSGQTSGEFGSIDTFDFSVEQAAIVVSTVGARVMAQKVVRGRFSLSQNCLLMLPNHPALVRAEFFVPQLRQEFRKLRAEIPDHMQPSLRVEDLRGKRLIAPCVDVQTEVVNKLDRLQAETERKVAPLRKQVHLLTEKRQALVTAGVAGELEIPGAAV